MTDEDIRDRLAALVAWYESRRKNVEREIAAAVARERERCEAVCRALQAEVQRDSEDEVFAWNRLERAASRIREGK